MLNKKQKVIFIGGAPTTGKTTIAQLASKRLGLPWISTDQIRETVRAKNSEKDYPALFRTEGYTAERFLNEFSAADIVELEMNQGKEVWNTIKKFIKEDPTWEQGVIIEGISILPHLVARDFKDNKYVKAVFLIDEDTDRIRDVVFKRGLWADAHTYSDDVKKKEVEWAWLFSHTLKEEAKKYDYPLIEINRNKDDLRSVIRIVG